MKILVYLRDGRTVYLIVGRGSLARLLGRDPAHEGDPVPVARGIWNPAIGEYVWTRSINLRYLSKNSVGHVEEPTDDLLYLAPPRPVEAPAEASL